MFRQQLASRTHQSNERAVKDVVNATMQTFMEKCRATADQGRCFCSVTKINIQPLCYMAGGAELVVQKFKEQMAEMGFPNGVGNPQIVVKVVHFGSHPKDSTTPFTSASSFPTCPILSAFRLRWPRHGFGFMQEEVDP